MNTEPNPHASALGRLSKGKPKAYSPEERLARANRIRTRTLARSAELASLRQLRDRVAMEHPEMLP